MIENADLIIFWLVVLSRLLVPLSIPKYPIPGIIASLIIDAVDQTVFQKFTSLNLDGYQSYDKALDIYYLTIAYIATLRNWSNQFAYKTGRFLWYYRLIGITIFELTYIGTGPRWLLLIFPNVFEYFFIFYEGVRLRWDPNKLSKRVIIYAAAFIWIFIKLPQEYWIHIAQLDTTDFIKENIVGVSKDASMAEIVSAAPWFVPVLVTLILLIIALFILIIRRLPNPDWKLSFNVDKYQPDVEKQLSLPVFSSKIEKIFNSSLFEKIVLVTLVTIIFVQILPNINATNLQIASGVSLIIISNVFIGRWVIDKGLHWKRTIQEFIVMSIVNLGLIILYSFLLPRFDGSINLQSTLFIAMLLTLIVVLYDRYKAIYVLRFQT